jgi:hypothetical protein
LALNLKNGESAMIEKGDLRLVVTYTDSRASKDRLNREKGLRKLEKQVRTGQLTKSSINNRGYNKYLKMDGQIKVAIYFQRFNQDVVWDGLKGYLTNANLSKDEIIANYGHLWQIENDLRIRPIYHRLQRRIETHICISFAVYKIYKELERQLIEKQSQISAEKAIEIAKTIYQIKAETPNGIVSHIMLLTDEQKLLAKMFNFG